MAKTRAHSAKSWHLSSKVFGLTALLVSSTVFGAAFQIQEENAGAYLGTAYAGTAAWAADASTLFYNTAGLTHIEGKQASAGMAIIWGSFDFDSTRTNMPVPPNTPIPGPQNDDPGGLSFVPSLYYSTQLADRWWFGFGVTAPFGLESVYDEAKVLRYVATSSKLRTIDIMPSIAWKATDWLSLGLGLDALWGEAVLEAKTNFSLNAPFSEDGFQKNRAADWTFGYHAGFLVDVSPETRFGAQYRSKFELKAEGDSHNFLPPGAPSAAAPGLFTTRKVQSAVTLPESVIFSAYHEIDCVALMADVSWTRWSRFKELQLSFEPQPAAAVPGNPNSINIDTVTEQFFTDTWRIALGMNYTYSPRWEFRLGVAFDESPVQEEYRTARIPDSDRIWLGLGVGFNCSDALHFDVGYAHLFFDDARLSDRGPNLVRTGNPALPNLLVEGDIDANANIFGVQIIYDFV